MESFDDRAQSTNSRTVQPTSFCENNAPMLARMHAESHGSAPWPSRKTPRRLHLRCAENGSQISRLVNGLDGKPKRSGPRLEVSKAIPLLPQNRAYALRLRCERELAIKPAVEPDGGNAGLPNTASQLLPERIGEHRWVNEEHIDTSILFDCPRKMADAYEDVLSRLGPAGVCLEALKIEESGVA